MEGVEGRGCAASEARDEARHDVDGETIVVLGLYTVCVERTRCEAGSHDPEKQSAERVAFVCVTADASVRKDHATTRDASTDSSLLVQIAEQELAGPLARDVAGGVFRAAGTNSALRPEITRTL